MKINKKIVVSCLVILGSVIYCVVHFMTYKTPEMVLKPLPEFPAKKVMEVAPANFVEIPAMERVSTVTNTVTEVIDTSVVVDNQNGNFAFEAPTSNKTEVVSEEQIRRLIEQSRLAAQQK